MNTYIAIINGKAVLAFRAEDDDEARAIIEDEGGSMRSDLRALAGMDGKSLWDGKSAIEVREATAAGRKLATFLKRSDVILSVTLPAPPPKLGYFDMNGDVEVFNKRVTEYLSITPLHNAVGTPAVTVPLHWTAEGLPVGLHFAGRYAEEAILLRLAAQLESARPWFNQVPEL
jgi:Asp-tRNA(Asn)/Glu-tRNA(Gln) amidotransferase A subunit family amidase